MDSICLTHVLLPSAVVGEDVVVGVDGVVVVGGCKDGVAVGSFDRSNSSSNSSTTALLLLRCILLVSTQSRFPLRTGERGFHGGLLS